VIARRWPNPENKRPSPVRGVRIKGKTPKRHAVTIGKGCVRRGLQGKETGEKHVLERRGCRGDPSQIPSAKKGKRDHASSQEGAGLPYKSEGQAEEKKQKAEKPLLTRNLSVGKWGAPRAKNPAHMTKRGERGAPTYHGGWGGVERKKGCSHR